MTRPAAITRREDRREIASQRRIYQIPRRRSRMLIYGFFTPISFPFPFHVFYVFYSYVSSSPCLSFYRSGSKKRFPGPFVVGQRDGILKRHASSCPYVSVVRIAIDRSRYEKISERDHRRCSGVVDGKPRPFERSLLLPLVPQSPISSLHASFRSDSASIRRL